MITLSTHFNVSNNFWVITYTIDISLNPNHHANLSKWYMVQLYNPNLITALEMRFPAIISTSVLLVFFSLLFIESDSSPIVVSDCFCLCPDGSKCQQDVAIQSKGLIQQIQCALVTFKIECLKMQLLL